MIKFRLLSVDELYQATLLIPEFKPNYPLSRYEETLSGTTHHSLGAFTGDNLMGFKVGYALGHGVFYSWVGGVLPDFRRQGIARALADHQEQWLIKNHYHTLRMKTRNKFRHMLMFAIGNGFRITGVEQKGDMQDWRIFLEKRLTP